MRDDDEAFKILKWFEDINYIRKIFTPSLSQVV